ncbi:MAG: sigma-54-dependent Fis family transcriptional regulator [Deltaproteobacteria bacterium]|jgi:transcriptional regulator with GAF, ATPase, and Fis domain|nr:sigma-54-dependent Fis family transcriptional regulator [Deltaproteobacteria bacterium]MBW2537827.1 sigma-54-dependent Fis family transcriptional regulator [Deltaproteobacteria bacterium]
MSPRRKHSQTLQDLMELTSRLSQDRELEDALQQISDAALRLLSADHTSVRLVDQAEGGLISYARSGKGRGRKPVRLLLGEGVAGWVCDHGKPVRIADVQGDERFQKIPRQGFTIRSLLAVPIWVGGDVAGVLAATSAQPRAFSSDDETQARLLANCAVPMIERARIEQFSVLPQLEHAMASPLRLHLVSELLEADVQGLSLDQAVLRSGRHVQDVQACLRPLVRWEILDELEAGGGFRLRRDVARETVDALRAIVHERAEQLGRERHVRHQLLGGMIGMDPKMQVVFEIVRQVARIDVPVLITGETGTGKELVARSIHDTSPRRSGFFGAVNCATLTETLFESQVFGHARGAFTGAVADFTGLGERCDGGSLFLDEVGDLSLANQVKLLRLLQEGTFTRLGETSPRRSDFRLVSATNRDLESMVRDGSFREDLYYRLAVFPVRIPSLRERIGDIEYLVDGILAGHARRFGTRSEPPAITPEAIAQLEKHRWPGNVRELENAMARAVIMAGQGPIRPEHLPEVQLLSESSGASESAEDPGVPSSRRAGGRSLKEVEREHIVRVLREQGDNIKATAAVLGVSRTTLYKKLKDYGIETK